MNELSTQQYYNQISANYDSLLSALEINKNVREVILSYFIKHVGGNQVLDFGGGTGLDLMWLVKAGYEVQFCEPSKGMMQKAKQLSLDNSLNSRVNFWNTQESDFTQWKPNQFSFVINGILANFAVFNCIENIELLFSKLSSLLQPGSVIIACVLNSNLTSLVKNYKREFILSLFTGKGIITYARNQDFIHRTFIHRSSHYKKASNIYFGIINFKEIKDSPFAILHMVMK